MDDEVEYLAFIIRCQVRDMLGFACYDFTSFKVEQVCAIEPTVIFQKFRVVSLEPACAVGKN